ncbi:Acetyltransferase (GNAT) family protein [Cognatiyoonia koreensis]|uniref:Acetyltransferase (GNAT) family protein n=1 Tax=Cognatiyoonia koreensis TaxID=364200 RepID=A0A1I0QMJ4_9RHOB|nr:GNAT family N-acetyltransferase [Cognatiyoonia koreensis]SEW27989.1 Acetyltransferase (GNAT) family protein [Cognatiyoonia koreensis]
MIRALDPALDLDRVHAFYRDAPDYWELAEGRVPGLHKARDFFTDGPPGCDPANSHRLGYFLDDRLSGLAELSFGFPAQGDAYLGLMMLGPWARSAGYGQVFLAHIVDLAQKAGSPYLFLAVMDSNPRGAAFWARHGFLPTGHSGQMQVGDKTQVLHRLVKPL